MKISGFIILAACLCASCSEMQDKKAGGGARDTVTGKKNHAQTIKEDELLHASGQYCNIKKIHYREGTVYIDADYIQFFTGEQAVREAKKRGDVEKSVNDKGDTIYSLPDDIYIVNENRKVHSIPLGSYAEIQLLQNNGGEAAWVKGDVNQLKERISGDAVFILTIENGVITRIRQQYLP